MISEDPDFILERSLEDLKAKQLAHSGAWGLGNLDRWDADLDAGTITFTTSKGLTVTAPMQVVGTYNEQDSTWLWAWDHPSIPPQLAEHAKLAKAFGERHELEWFTTRKIVCEQSDCWQFTALASYLGKAQGGYCGPAGSTFVFMTFGQVQIRDLSAPTHDKLD